MSEISGHADLIDELGGANELSRALEVTHDVVRHWKWRGRIPPIYWHRVLQLPRATELGLTYEWLLFALSRQRGRPEIMETQVS